MIVIDQSQNILAQYGNRNVIGYGTKNTQQGLYAPYGAKVIGDYTGLTPLDNFPMFATGPLRVQIAQRPLSFATGRPARLNAN